MLWLLAILDLGGVLEGKTRVQKLAFLVWKEFKGIRDAGFYTDWQPSKYGPFSASLESDLAEGIKNGLVLTGEVRNDYGFKVKRFVISDQGKAPLDEFKSQQKDLIKKITPLVQRYSKMPLMELLHDVYYSSPEFTISSKIKSEVAGRTGLQESLLEEPAEDEKDEP